MRIKTGKRLSVERAAYWPLLVLSELAALVCETITKALHTHSYFSYAK